LISEPELIIYHSPQLISIPLREKKSYRFYPN